MRSFRWFLLAIACLFAPVISAAQWGVAPDGTKGRLHVVVEGDTLWDITQTYLGTPWVWPVVWKENEIDNPHLIEPGDVIWITERGMRKLTAEEVSQVVPVPEGEAGNENSGLSVEPATADGEVGIENEGSSGDTYDPFASLDSSGADIDHIVEYPGLHRFGFVSPKELAGAGSVLGSHEESYWVSQERKTIVSLGEGQVHVGDRYTVFRTRNMVRHPETGESVGAFVQRLGTAEIAEIHPESSYVRVLNSYAEIEPGDRLLPYENEPTRFNVSPTDFDLGGVIVAKQPYRMYVGEGDLVVIDRGRFDGVQVGNRLEIFRSGHEVMDPVSGAAVLVPDDVLGHMFVLKVGVSTSLALIRSTRMEVQVGDHFRAL